MSSEFLINQMVSYLEFSQFKQLKEEMLRRKRLTREEFIEMWVELVEGENVDEEYLKKLHDLFAQIDYNMDGHVNWEEFSGNYVECAQTHFSKINSYHPVPKVVLTPQVVPQKMIYIPELRKIATCGKPEVSGLWNCHDSTNYGFVKQHKRDIQHILYIPQKSMIVSSSSDRTINLYDSQFKFLNKIYTPSTQLSLIYDDFADVMYSGGSVGDPGSQYYGINVWDLESNPARYIDHFKARDQHRDFVMDMLLLQQLNILISCSLDKTIKLWDTRKSVMKSTKEGGHKQGITHISFSDEYKLLVSSGSERFAVLWNPLSTKPLHKLEGHRKPLIGSQTIRGTPEVITVDISGMIMIWDIRTLKKTPIQILKPLNYEYHKRTFKSFCYNEGSREIICSGEEEMNYWSSIVTSHNLHISLPIIKIKYNKVFKQLLLMSGKVLFEWSAMTGNHHKSIKILRGGEDTTVTDFEIVQKMRHILSVTNGGEILLHNLVDGSLKNKMSLNNNEEIQNVHLIPDYIPILKNSREFVALVCVKGMVHFLDVDNFVIINSFQVSNRVVKSNFSTYITSSSTREEKPVVITNSKYSEKYKLFVTIQSNRVRIYNLKGRRTHHSIGDSDYQSVDISSSCVCDEHDCFITTNEQGYIQIYSFPKLRLLSCVYIKPEIFGPRFVSSKNHKIIVAQNETIISIDLIPLLTKLQDDMGRKIKIDSSKDTFVVATRVTVQKNYIDDGDENGNGNGTGSDNNSSKNKSFRKARRGPIKERIRSKIRANMKSKPRFLSSLSKKIEHTSSEFFLHELHQTEKEIHRTPSLSSLDNNSSRKLTKEEEEEEEEGEEEEEEEDVEQQKIYEAERKKNFYKANEKVEVIRYKAYWSTPLLKGADCPLFLEDRYGKIGEDGKARFFDDEEHSSQFSSPSSSASQVGRAGTGREEFSLLQWDVEEEERKSTRLRVSRIDKISNVLVVVDPGYVICGFRKDGVGFLNLYDLSSLKKVGEKPGTGKLWNWEEKRKQLVVPEKVQKVMMDNMIKKLKKKRKKKKRKKMNIRM